MKKRRRLKEPWTEVRVAGRKVATVEFGYYPPRVTPHRTGYLSPTERMAAAQELRQELEDRGYDGIDHEAAYQLLFPGR